jgi:hypothetical protein
VAKDCLICPALLMVIMIISSFPVLRTMDVQGATAGYLFKMTMAHISCG